MSSQDTNNDIETLQTIPEDLFHGMVKEAATTGESLSLTGRRVVLRKPVKLARSESLHIVGGTLVRLYKLAFMAYQRSRVAWTSTHKVCLWKVGECHSIFSIGTDRTKGPPALTLMGCSLKHMLTSTDRREVITSKLFAPKLHVLSLFYLNCVSQYFCDIQIGACVFVMGKARVEIHGSTLSSVAGFGLWYGLIPCFNCFISSSSGTFIIRLWLGLSTVDQLSSSSALSYPPVALLSLVSTRLESCAMTAP